MQCAQDRIRVAEELSAIFQLPRADLVARWNSAHGLPPPKGISRRLLEYSAAYRLQVTVMGGLKVAVRRKLCWMKDNEIDVAKKTGLVQQAKTLSPGTRLVREWHGRTHTVEAVDGGFVWNGERYASLSRVARAITGARWSGPRFFGL
jgi:hypothetical protein